MRIPKKIKIAGVNYTVKVKDKLDHTNNYYGTHIGYRGIITLSKTMKGEKLSDDMVLSTFLHEILHGIDYCYCNEILSEKIISRLSRILYQVLKENDLKFDSDTLPDSVNICGYTYKVVKIDNCGDMIEDLASFVKFDEFKFCFLKDDEKSVDVDNVGILFSIMSVIMSDQFFDIDDLESLPIKPFCHGLYQVIKDNKLEKVFRCNTIVSDVKRKKPA